MEERKQLQMRVECTENGVLARAIRSIHIARFVGGGGSKKNG